MTVRQAAALIFLSISTTFFITSQFAFDALITHLTSSPPHLTQCTICLYVLVYVALCQPPHYAAVALHIAAILLLLLIIISYTGVHLNLHPQATLI